MDAAKTYVQPIIDYTADYAANAWLNVTPTKAAVTTAVVGLASGFIYFKIKFQYWKKRGVDGPPPTMFLGNITEQFTEPIHHWHRSTSKKYGKIVGVYSFSLPSLLVSDPELVRQITVKDFSTFPNRQDVSGLLDDVGKKMLSVLNGDDWKRVRNILTPTFTSSKMKKMYHIMSDCGADATASLKRVDGSTIDLKDFFGKYTLDVIARCCFATNCDAYNETGDNDFLVQLKKAMTPKMWVIFLLFILPHKVFRFLTKHMPGMKNEFFINLVKHLIKERREKGIKGDDFLQLLLDAEADESELNGNSDGSKMKNKTLDENEIIANSILFLAAGYETTATLLTFVFYNLAVHPDVQERLRQEVEALGDLNYDKVSNLDYLEAVINETMRIYPPAIGFDRVPIQDYTLPGTDIVVKKGTSILFSNYTIHMDPENFPEPEKFDPLRFMPENKDQIKPFTFLPFGAGPRNCIGLRFAQIEAKLLIAELVLAMSFIQTEETNVPPKFRVLSGLLAAAPLKVKVEARKE